MFIPKYKYFNKSAGTPAGYQVSGYVNTEYLANMFTSMRGAGIFEVRGFLVGDANAQILFFGSKATCHNYMKAYADSNGKNIPAPPEGVVSVTE